MTELWREREVDLARLLADGEVSAREVLDAHLARIEQVNPTVNAIVTFALDRAHDDATRADAAHARGESLGPLHGLPIAHKDLADTAGIRTTMGSPILADNVPVADELMIARLRAAGCVTVGETNTPEFGAGSHTFNPLFGATRNPWDPSRSAGGRAAAPPLRWRPGWCRSPTAATSAARCATGRRSAAWWVCVPRRARCQAGRRPTRGTHSPPRDRGAAVPPMWRCCST